MCSLFVVHSTLLFRFTSSVNPSFFFTECFRSGLSRVRTSIMWSPRLDTWRMTCNVRRSSNQIHQCCHFPVFFSFATSASAFFFTSFPPEVSYVHVTTTILMWRRFSWRSVAFLFPSRWRVLCCWWLEPRHVCFESSFELILGGASAAWLVCVSSPHTLRGTYDSNEKVFQVQIMFSFPLPLDSDSVLFFSLMSQSLSRIPK